MNIRALLNRFRGIRPLSELATVDWNRVNRVESDCLLTDYDRVLDALLCLGFTLDQASLKHQGDRIRFTVIK
jgi:hypothetical protein